MQLVSYKVLVTVTDFPEDSNKVFEYDNGLIEVRGSRGIAYYYDNGLLELSDKEDTVYYLDRDAFLSRYSNVQEFKEENSDLQVSLDSLREKIKLSKEAGNNLPLSAIYYLGKEYYLEEMKAVNWEAIKRACIQNCLQELEREYDGSYLGRDYLGSVFSLTPSGKFYMPWTSNVTEVEAEVDSLWWEAVEESALEHGVYISSGDGDDIFAVVSLWPNDLIEVDPDVFDLEYTANLMVESLLKAAYRDEADISALTVENINVYLDSQFQDGGQVRTEEFLDLADDYALNFGDQDTEDFDKAKSRCVLKAIEKFQQQQ